ncbi:hypothetical protein [Undibacterium umbellatum]|uniref:Uncharacterized protein n=1 Tax=Undibacterium umbellatum TaxID=2762300 RepID=A0ABR6ZC03_9BURK|nr:hypothetical protein [Undibacterium umbellatum]MBC3909288.1 hypothetical protein [Undibacterium umbellatum]
MREKRALSGFNDVMHQNGWILYDGSEDFAGLLQEVASASLPPGELLVFYSENHIYA